MTLSADLYFSFRSPYSYLTIGRYRAMAEAYELAIALKPVYPLAIRQPDFFERNHPNWHEGDLLAGAAERAGLDWAELAADVEAQPDILDAEIAANQAALEAAGHWGVPTLVFDGEPFFGQDRIEMVQWRMEQKGLMLRHD